MVLTVVTVAAAVVVGWLRGGTLRHLAAIELRGAWLLGLSVAAQLALWLATRLADAGPALAVPLLGLSQAALLAFLWANRLQPGIALAFLGFALNATVILANGGMPVERAALAAVSSGPVDITPGKHRFLQPGDRLPWLADVIALPPLKTVVSVGDIVLAAGVGVLVTARMQPSRRATGRRSGADPVGRGG